jgi:hypothetical protein
MFSKGMILGFSRCIMETCFFRFRSPHQNKRSANRASCTVHLEAQMATKSDLVTTADCCQAAAFVSLLRPARWWMRRVKCVIEKNFQSQDRGQHKVGDESWRAGGGYLVREEEWGRLETPSPPPPATSPLAPPHLIHRIASSLLHQSTCVLNACFCSAKVGEMLVPHAYPTSHQPSSRQLRASTTWQPMGETRPRDAPCPLLHSELGARNSF